MIILLYHKPTKTRATATAPDNAYPKQVLFELVMEMNRLLTAQGIDIRKSERDEFMFVDNHGRGYHEEPSQNFNTFTFG